MSSLINRLFLKLHSVSKIAIFSIFVTKFFNQREFRNKSIKICARDSSLSKAQTDEILDALQKNHPTVTFDPVWIKTTGDIDLKTSLRSLEKTDFFTKEIDQLQLSGHCRISIHSAKDLPDPLSRGLVLVALTHGVNPADSLVLQEGKKLQDLTFGAKIGTSSARREQNIKALCPDLECVDIRGDILARLELLDRGYVQGVVIAEAALIRLKLNNRQRILLPGVSAPLQGQLAVLAQDGDEEMKELFRCIDSRFP